MQRLTLNYLKRWKAKSAPLPLLIRGARQVGKTWLVREFGKSYPDFVEINLESTPEYHKVFKELFGKPIELIATLSLLTGKKIVPGETLFFIDEIQGSKEAILSLRYFKELLPGLHVIAAGSLLEFSFQDFSYPVGRIEFLHLFPLNFEEYLLAQSRSDLVEAIRSADERRPLPEALHDKLLEEAAMYSLIGGMPEVVKAYLQAKDLRISQEMQQVLIASFREDFHKYASRTNVEYVRLVFQALPRMLGKKWKYSQVDAGIKSRELANALHLLEKAGLAYRAVHSSANGLPLGAQVNPRKFKVFFLDIGLCQRLLGLDLAKLYLGRKEILAHRGGMAEQFVAQELISMNPPNQSPQLFYWHREEKSSQAEVDFLLERPGEILPIEVKSAGEGRLRSLHLFLKEKGGFVREALKISTANFSRLDKIISWPFYALFRLESGSSSPILEKSG